MNLSCKPVKMDKDADLTVRVLEILALPIK
jgi:hypothetical protein